jgi:transcriptional regulator with XRE-family HTH domain
MTGGAMSTGEPPAVARRRVRLALRAAREASGFTQGHVAEALDWSLSKVNRIEKGDVTVSRTDLLALLEMYGVTDQGLINDLVQAARTSRQRGWWDDPHYREHLTPAMLQLLQFESEASAVRHFHPTLVPGLLQTPAYAQFVMDFWQSDMSDGDRQARYQARMRRREQALGRPGSPDYFVILDESVLYRELGGASVMIDQLRQILRYMRDPNVHIRVATFAEVAPIALLGPFTIFDLGDEENAVLYREGIFVDEIVSSPAVTRRHRDHFEHMWAKSLDEDATERLVESKVANLIASLDRRTS